MDETAFDPVEGLPGVVTCPPLLRHLLALAPVDNTNLLCCVDCRPGYLLNLSTVSKHIFHFHQSKERGLTSTKLQKICSGFNVFTGLLSDFPTPQKVCAPVAFLGIEDAFKCVLCEDEERNYFGVSPSSRYAHFKTFHFNYRKRYTEFERPVKVQSFCSGYTTKNYFEVDSKLKPIDQQALEEQYTEYEASPDELVEAFIHSYKPLKLQRPVQVTLQDTSPFLFYTGWAKHVLSHDSEWLCRLVALPEEGDPWRPLFDAAVRIFKQFQVELDGVPETYRKNIMDDGNGPPTKAFRCLQDDTANDYAKTYGRWAVFVLRLHEQQVKKNDTRYAVHFSERQERAIGWAINYCTSDKTQRASGRRVLAELALAFWLPEVPEDFEHLAEDQFNDPTVRFAALINLLPDGSFQTPRNATHNLVRVKYFIRAGLFLWARDEQKERKKPVESQYKDIAAGLSQRVLTPFALVCIAVSHGTTYAATSTELPNVLWTGADELSLDGQHIRWSSFRRALTQEIIDLERHILDNILLGIPLAQCGFNITESTVIHDNFSDRSMGYSMFTDPRNSFFTEMKTALGVAFLRDPRGSKLHRGRNAKNEVLWKEAAVAKWMADCDYAMERMAMLMHYTGGQPGRGVELCLVKVSNGLYRVRGFYCLSAGRIVYVLFYNKTTGNTGRDWIVAHALPWSVGRLFLIMHGLVNPLLALLVERVAGTRARYIQENSAFATAGVEMQSDDLSRVVGHWFRSHFEVNMRLRSCRQLMIAAQRKYMPEAYSAIRRALQIVDAQAGHSTETANRHYAIDASETHALAQDTIAKEVASAARWWPVCLEAEVLNEKDRAEGQAAAATIALSDGAPLVHRCRTPPPPENPMELAAKALTEPEVFETMIERCIAKITTTLPASLLTGFLPAERLRVHPDHLDYLRRFVGSQDATWTSDAQSQAFIHVLRRQSSVLCVLRTGGGKSLLFAGSAAVEPGITVVIFPLRALLLNQVQLSIRRDPRRPFVVWKSGAAYSDGVVALSVEKAVTPGFATWASQMNDQGRLIRIVIDEAHMVITESNYRAVMHNLATLVGHGVPLVCLTATLPPSQQPEWRRLLGSPTFTVIRESTQRPNISLRLALYSSRDQTLFALTNHCRRYEAELAPGEGIMIQCRTHAEVRALSQLLSRPGYHSDLPPEEKEKIAQQWTAGEVATVVSTTALGTGVHHPACRAVLHFGPSWGMTDYAQEVGRAGRDGKPALAILFATDPYPAASHPDLKGYAELLYALQSGECLRYHMSCYIDGDELATTCAGGGFAPCTPCLVALNRAKGGSGLPTPGGHAVDVNKPKIKQQNEWVEPHLPTFSPTVVNPPRLPSSKRPLPVAPDAKPSPSNRIPKAVSPPPVATLDSMPLSPLPKPPARVLVPTTPSPTSSYVPAQDQGRVPRVLVPGTPSSSGAALASSGEEMAVIPVSPQPRSNDLDSGNTQSRAHSSSEDTDDIMDLTSSDTDPPESDDIESASAIMPTVVPVGVQVLKDAARNKRRRIHTAGKAPSPREQLETYVEDGFKPLSFHYLLFLKQRSSKWCMYCILYGHTHVGHTLHEVNCPQAPGLSGTLKGYTRGGRTFLQAKSQGSLPSGNVVCYFCWWPMGNQHYHFTGTAPQSCSCRDQIPQLCWLVYCDEELREIMARYFKLDTSIMESADLYWKWLASVRREVSWRERASVLTNGQCVFIYFLYVVRPVISYKK